MVQFACYLGRVLCKTRLIFPRINGPILDFLLELCDLKSGLSVRFFRLLGVCN